MPSELSNLWEQMRRVAKETGRVALLILAVLAKVAEDYQNMPVACARCRRIFPRKVMCHLWDIPRYAEQWWLDFCPECANRLREAHEYAGIYQDENRKLLAQLRRAMAQGLPATLTLDEWLATLDHFGWLCAYCRVMPYEHIEHFVPIERGGGTTAENCVPACKRCNSAKGVLHPDEICESSRDPAAIARVRNFLATQCPMPTIPAPPSLPLNAGPTRSYALDDRH